MRLTALKWILIILCAGILAGCTAAPEETVAYSEESVYAFLEEAVLAEKDRAVIWFEDGDEGFTADTVDAVLRQALHEDGLLSYYVSEYAWGTRAAGPGIVRLEVEFTYDADSIRFDDAITQVETPEEAVHAVIETLQEDVFSLALRIPEGGWDAEEVAQIISVAVDNACCASTLSCTYVLAPAENTERQLLVLRCEPTVGEADYSTYQNALEARADSLAEEILAQGYTEETDLYRAAHDAVLAEAEYDTAMARTITQGDVTGAEMGPDYTAYGALVTGSTVCYGYAAAYKLLCDRLGLPCWTVAGSAWGEAHQWNLVCVDGRTYPVDCTWDDALGAGQYAYFLRPADLASHRAEDGWIYSW